MIRDITNQEWINFLSEPSNTRPKIVRLSTDFYSDPENFAHKVRFTANTLGHAGYNFIEFENDLYTSKVGEPPKISALLVFELSSQ